MTQEFYRYSRRVAYHETDAMGVAHHSNYVKYFEEARVSWLRDQGLIEIHSPLGPYTFAVVDLNCEFKKPCTFEDSLVIAVQGKMDRSRILFKYAVWSERLGAWIATGSTTLVPINAELRPVKLPVEVRNLFAKLPWQEVWPPAQI